MTFCDKTQIQLLCLMQLQMELLHFFGWYLTHSPHVFLSPRNFDPLLRFHAAWSTLTSLSSCLIACFSSQVDFTSCGGFLCIAAAVLVIIGIVTGVVLSFQYVRTAWSNALIYYLCLCFSVWGEAAQLGVSAWPIQRSLFSQQVPWLHMLYAAIGAIIYTLVSLHSREVKGRMSITRLLSISMRHNDPYCVKYIIHQSLNLISSLSSVAFFLDLGHRLNKKDGWRVGTPTLLWLAADYNTATSFPPLQSLFYLHAIFQWNDFSVDDSFCAKDGL